MSKLIGIAAAWLFGIIPGLVAALVSYHYVFLDWGALNRSFLRWEQLSRAGVDDRAIKIADTYQNAFRINCFAEGVGVLLGLLLATAGLHALVVLTGKPARLLQGGAV